MKEQEYEVTTHYKIGCDLCIVNPKISSSSRNALIQSIISPSSQTSTISSSSSICAITLYSNNQAGSDLNLDYYIEQVEKLTMEIK
jgi:hypothetical protein